MPGSLEGFCCPLGFVESFDIWQLCPFGLLQSIIHVVNGVYGEWFLGRKYLPSHKWLLYLGGNREKQKQTLGVPQAKSGSNLSSFLDIPGVYIN